MIKFILIIGFFSVNISSAQEMLKGFVISKNTPVGYATILNERTNQIFQTSENGEFNIEFLSINDSLSIFCLGFDSSKIKISDIIQNKKIELNQREEVLDEIVIIFDKKNEDKKWKVFGKKRNKKIVNREMIIEGCGLISTYIINEDVKISAIRFLVYSNPFYKDYLDKHPIVKTYKKKVRAIFMINSFDIENNILPNHFVDLIHKDESEYIEIEFGKTLELKAGETISFGLELIPENLKKTIKDNIIGIVTVSNNKINKQKTIMKTFKPKEMAEQICNSIRLDDIYFELKVEK